MRNNSLSGERERGTTPGVKPQTLAPACLCSGGLAVSGPAADDIIGYSSDFLPKWLPKERQSLKSYFCCPFMVCSGYCGFIFLKFHIGILFPPNHVIFWVWWAVSELASVVLLTMYSPSEHGGGGMLTCCWSFLRWKAQPFRNLTSSPLLWGHSYPVGWPARPWYQLTTTRYSWRWGSPDCVSWDTSLPSSATPRFLTCGVNGVNACYLKLVGLRNFFFFFG